MDRTPALETLALLQANWSHVEVADMTIEVWVDALREIPEEEGRAAAKACVLELAHFPNVSEFRARWKAVRRALSSPPAQHELPVPPRSAEQRSSALANISRLRDQIRGIATLPSPEQATPETEARAAAARPVESAGLPPEPCYLDDHKQCGSGPVRVPEKEVPRET